MRRRLTFLLLILTILGGGSAYIALRLATNAAHVVIVAMLLALPLFFFFVPRRGPKEPTTPIGKFVQQAGFASLGLLSWLCVVAFVRDLILLGTLTFAPYATATRIEQATGGTPAFLLALALALYGSFRALRGPRVRHVGVSIDGLPSELHGLRVVQISDLHIGPTIGPRYVGALVRLVETLEPHLVALTGDIFDGTVADLAPAAALLGELGPKDRVFFVPGNHEYYHSFATWRPELDRLGFTTLVNRGVSLFHADQHLWIGGVSDPAGEMPDPARAAEGSARAAFRLLLSHRPSYTDAAEAAGFHLQLSGHTHAGQFFPWTLVVGWFHRYFKGLARQGNLWIYVSPGTGTWGPPMRVGTTPEVTCLTLGRA